MTYEAVIGLEVHVQLMTKTKLFSAASTQFGAMPNAHVSLIDLGLPGTLPVINEKAIIMAIQFGYAIGAKFNDLSTFERKNYFYPDLPKGYQISQFFNPIVCDGQLDILLHSGQTKTITIQRAHLEEDAGKSIHDKREGLTGIDLNRAGTPLFEIVTTPCMHSAFEAVA
jgi:aspartyl-tRNA(Asn)/glutamyl-tRNA(Gln) amidotransferase subunit B